MNNMEIMVRIKNVYGTDKIYPVSPNAKLFADIAGTTTLRPSDLKAIQELGYRVVVEQPTYADNLRTELDYFYRRPKKC